MLHQNKSSGVQQKPKQTEQANLQSLNIFDDFLQEGAGGAALGWWHGAGAAGGPAGQQQAEQQQHRGEALRSSRGLGMAASWLPFIRALCEEMINTSPQRGSS